MCAGRHRSGSSCPRWSGRSSPCPCSPRAPAATELGSPARESPNISRNICTRFCRARRHDVLAAIPVDSAHLLLCASSIVVRLQRLGQNGAMASYTVNDHAVAQARRLIDAHQYVLASVWNDVQPSAGDENAFLESHSWDDYAAWHLGLTEGAYDETKARYAFVYGDFRRVHRMGLIACQYRAAEWRHKEVELAAHELLQHLDSTRA
jgi:hypothetical protein